MTFEYAPVIQRSPDWFNIRKGRVTASRLSDWLAVSKAKGKEGTPLQARKDYERELWFERKFGVSYNNYVSEAMLDGQDYEDLTIRQYEKIKGVKVENCGIYYNDYFAASPDGLVGEGLVECKVVRDNTFTEILLGGVPEKHYKQIQGQLWASGKKWCDYVALNLNTKKISIWRVEPNQEFISGLENSVQEPLTVEEVDLSELYDVSGALPDRMTMGLESTKSNNVDQW